MKRKKIGDPMRYHGHTIQPVFMGPDLICYWRPIETAPKDGSTFIGRRLGSITNFIDDSNPIEGTYPGGDWKVVTFNDATLCFFNGETFMDSEGLEYGNDFIETQQPEGSPDGDPPLKLTHWMPLPEPPTEEDAG